MDNNAIADLVTNTVFAATDVVKCYIAAKFENLEDSALADKMLYTPAHDAKTNFIVAPPANRVIGTIMPMNVSTQTLR